MSTEPGSVRVIVIVPAGSSVSVEALPGAPATTTTPAPPPATPPNPERGVLIELTCGDLTTLADGEPVELRLGGVPYLIRVKP